MGLNRKLEPKATDCLGFPFDLPFVRCLKTWPSNRIVAAVVSEFALYGICWDLVGVELHKLQFTPQSATTS